VGLFFSALTDCWKLRRGTFSDFTRSCPSIFRVELWAESGHQYQGWQLPIWTCWNPPGPWLLCLGASEWLGRAIAKSSALGLSNFIINFIRMSFCHITYGGLKLLGNSFLNPPSPI
jgi:hypothetical protein